MTVKKNKASQRKSGRQQERPGTEKGKIPKIPQIPKKSPKSTTESTLELLFYLQRGWRREIREREKQRFIRRSIKAVISTAMIHADRLETFAPIEPSDEMKKFLQTADLHALQGVLAEVLLNFFTRFRECEKVKK